jgi:N6-L-threonylcarbamoyladenine synthase
MIILGIETSCDETAVAILKDDTIKSDLVSSQFFHSKYGGVVPELASRAHLRTLVPLYKEALKNAEIKQEDITSIAVTYGPGLIGSILVGLNFAKAFSFGAKIPFIGVNHVEAHLLSVFLEKEKPDFPFVSLIVSGGHTLLVLVKDIFKYEILGSTKDDSAGEAFDKVAKMLGLGYPGGPIIDILAKIGNQNFYQFPRPCIKSEDFSFSFSGLKTSVLYFLRGLKKKNPELNLNSEPLVNDVSACFQAAVIDVLSDKIISAAKKYKVKNIAVVGGVSANSGLRKRIKTEAIKHDLNLFIPDLKYSTDNAAMIALVGKYRYINNLFSSLELKANPNLTLDSI